MLQMWAGDGSVTWFVNRLMGGEPWGSKGLDRRPDTPRVLLRCVHEVADPDSGVQMEGLLWDARQSWISSGDRAFSREQRLSVIGVCSV